ncbi:vWA domain-containing protein [Virgibacillus sp. W0430]|uniref:vWA domain-containing protein n=1 Tax=Virgibacillus sp. W0430 TaxID=3391580 RepID=UPI003F4841EF
MKPNQWLDLTIDSGLFLQLQDLATVLSGDAEFIFDYSYSSYIDVIEKKITGSRLWDTENDEMKLSGYKSDLFLRMLGTLYYTNVRELQRFKQDIDALKLKKFATQLVALLEDIRLEEMIIRERPGTKYDFSIRTDYLRHYFYTQLTANVTRGFEIDAFYCIVYLTLRAEQPDPAFTNATKEQLDRLENIKPIIHNVYAAKNTKDIIKITKDILLRLDTIEKDMVNSYFPLPIQHLEKLNSRTMFDALTRTDSLANDDEETVNDKDNDYIDERFSTWHRENENSDRKQTFLQFELEVGTRTTLLGGEARETEDADEALGTIQGASGTSEKNDYSQLEGLDKTEEQKGNDQKEANENTDNKHAVALYKYAHAPTQYNIKAYEDALQIIEPYKRRLEVTIEKTIEHKRNEQRQHLIFGRLSKQMLPLIVYDNPRVFYKKTAQSKDMNAAFTLLVDCSASMHDKMEQTKKSLILFHEVLNKLKVPHSIAGFWEDAMEATESYQPNYFHIIRNLEDSFYKRDGAKIMQLEPEEDNRDGFSIRIATRQLWGRNEKNKFLLVFSDGEPAATGYDQNGVIDTTVAVSEARKKGIHVIGIYLANGDISEKEDRLMQNIYGKERVMVPNISELTDRLAPLLKKLLLQTM